jgi:hypothetical protein
MMARKELRNPRGGVKIMRPILLFLIRRLYHVPAITSFLEEDWQPPAPEYNGYPPWIQWYLNA